MTEKVLPPLGSDEIRQDFPILHQMINDKPLIYLDNAATTQKPTAVIDAISNYYLKDNANVHRGIHTLSERATQQFEDARTKVQHFIHAQSRNEIVFCRSTTEAINMVAQSFVAPRLLEDDEIILTSLEHHSNIVPWQLVCGQVGAKLKVLPIDDRGELQIDLLDALFTSKTKFLAVSHISNALGTINPIKKIIDMAHSHNVPVLVDGAQALPHQRVNMKELDCEFYAFSGHKMYAPTGIGVLYGKSAYLEDMNPYQGGGEMISQVSFELTEYNSIPYKFEAGTPNIAGAIALGSAIDYLANLGMENINAYQKQLIDYALQHIQHIPGLTLVGTSDHRASILSFVLDKVHAHDVGTVLNSMGIAVRSGHHCAMPVMAHFMVPATTRISLSFYNNKKEIDTFISALEQVKKVIGT